MRRETAQGYAVAVLALAALTAAAWPLRHMFLPPNLVMLYLLIVALIARRYQRGPAIMASVLAVAAFDFFFIHPQLTLAVTDVQYLVTFAVMLLVGIFISTLTGQLEAQVAARSASQTQVESERLRSTLLSSISHDLRTPLAGISGAAGTMLTLPEDQLREAAPVLLRTIRDESDRLSLMVSNILEMTRLEAGEVRLKLEWLPLEEPIGAALAALSPRLENHPASVQLPDDLPMVKADAVLIERVFANLLDNALKYSPPGSLVEITAQATANHLTVYVSDRGSGLLTGNPGELFRKFSRANGTEATSSSGSRGSGLGLSICKAIIEAHGGTITGANRAGGGAVFSFSLPITEDQPQPPLEETVGEEA